MYVFKLKSLKGINAIATLITAVNPYVNGRMPVANDYRGNVVLIPGTEYKLEFDAVRNVTPELEVPYSISGSWISGILHVTNLRKCVTKEPAEAGANN